MLREEALQYKVSQLCGSATISWFEKFKPKAFRFLINKIYDDFENRKCTACNYWAPNNGWVRECCMNGVGNDYSEEFEINNPDKFYCSDWKETK